MNIEANQVYKPLNNERQLFRRVVAVFNGHVIYSVGSDENRTCKVESFKKWIKSRKAENTHEAN